MLKFDHFGILAPFYERFIPPRRPEKIIELLAVPPGAAVLDAGGGTGRVAQYLCQTAGLVVVADQSCRMLGEARKKEGLQPACSLTERLPFADGSFDGIIMVDALHHVAHQGETIREMWRTLLPGGRIVIEEPDIRLFSVKLIAIAEKIALMRSHFLSAAQILGLFPSRGARVRIENDGAAVWIVAEKERVPQWHHIDCRMRNETETV